MKLYSALLTGAVIALGMTAAGAEQIDAEKISRNLCSFCHGVDGRNTQPIFPQLAGQVPAYIVEQLRAFHDHTRSDRDAQDYMWGWAGLLSDAEIDALANYFAAQKPSPGEPGDPKLMAKGKEIFERGNVSENVPACYACHGKNAEGMSPFPRLAGQHAAYLMKQLNVFRGQQRPAAVVMHQIVQSMTPEEVEAVATYLQSK